MLKQKLTNEFLSRKFFAFVVCVCAFFLTNKFDGYQLLIAVGIYTGANAIVEAFTRFGGKKNEMIQ